MASQKTIGEPSLHDWRYEEFSQKEDARDEALEYYAKNFKSDLALEFRCGNFERIDSAMGEVLENIFNHVGKTEKFCRTLFAMCLNPQSDNLALADLLNKEMEKVIEQEFDKTMRERDESDQ